MNKILVCYGTRPEYLKIKPILIELRKKQVPFSILKIGQHTTTIREEPFDFFIEVMPSGNRLDSIFTSILHQSNLFKAGRNEASFTDFSHVLVQGDTTAAAAAAVAAFHKNIPVIHVEAGMRTYDIMNPYPEEVNRKIISAVASVHFCASEREASNLYREGQKGLVKITGNPVIDNLVGTPTSYGNKVVVTMHRRENHEKLDEWFRAIDDLAASSDYEFILPLHPNPNVQKHKDLFKHVKVVDPVPHSEMLDLLANSIAVISDSGGVSEECAYLNKICLVCRSATERGQSVYEILCPTPTDLTRIWNGVKLESGSYERRKGAKCPYGDGNASERIASHLQDILG
jgi:UDP-N-acetylglucosamine 2-epimerase (non-hydrolysing)